MEYGVYSIRDAKVGFTQLVLEQSDQTAIRNFAYAMRRPDTVYQEFTQDFDLYRLGYFDTESGLFDLHTVPELLISGPVAARR